MMVLTPFIFICIYLIICFFLFFYLIVEIVTSENSLI